MATGGTLIRCRASAATALRTRGERARCPACGSPRLLRHPRTRHARHRACGLRCVLRRDREARRSRARRQAADHRRRQARRGLDRLLHRAHLRRPLGDADVQGAQALPARDRGPPGHGEIRRRRPRGARADVRADAAGRAALDRRGVHGPDRHRAAARHERRPGRSRALPERVEDEIGITVSIGLSANKFLAKIASDLDKPRGFAVLGPGRGAWRSSRAKPVRLIWGVGKASAARLANATAFDTIADLQRADETRPDAPLRRRGPRLWRLARGIDDRIGQSGARDQERVGRDDFRRGHRRRTGRWRRSCGRLRNGCRRA